VRQLDDLTDEQLLARLKQVTELTAAGQCRSIRPAGEERAAFLGSIYNGL
jgi:hypothetical protein